MKFKAITIFIGFLLFASEVDAQENLDFSNKKSIVSPQVNADKSVTFRLFAPFAKEVLVDGNWPIANGAKNGRLTMKKDDAGLWSVNSSILPADLYSYSFLVDGLKVTDPNNVYILRDIASVMNIFIVDGEKSAPYQTKDTPHGTVAKRWYNSAGLKMARRVTIYTPPGYEETKERFPVLYLLHGVGGDEEAWIQQGRVAQIMDNLIAAAKIKPMIVVMPNGHTSNAAAPGESSKGFYKPEMMTPDVFNGDMETNFKEIVNFTDANYRTKAKKEDRALAGLSMGGFHSLYISANQPELFNYVGLFSPAIIAPKASKISVYQNIDDKLKKLAPGKFKLYWIGIGKTDFLYKNVQDYKVKLDSLNFKYIYNESEGGHTWSNWREYLCEFTPLLFK